MNPQQFFSELKRRNVYKVAVAYSVVAWLLIQAASILLPTFEAPGWVMKAFVVFLGLGFVMSVMISWAFEATPEGLKRTEEVPPEIAAKLPSWSPRKFATFVLIVALIATGLLVYQFLRPKTKSGDTPLAGEGVSISAKSIAVLPFENLSDDRSNSYFADGIQEEILTRLAKISDLKVISRTSTQRYKSAPADLHEIVKQLGVANVLEGSVQKAGDQVRITVQLINALTDNHLWADTYDRKMIDVFGVESDVAQKIAASLEAKLTGREKAEIIARGTNNSQAYETYLRAIALRGSQSDADSADMRDLLREAVRLDSNFAEAWAWLAAMEALRYSFPEESPAQKERAHNTAEMALRLAPDSSDAQGAMGLYFYYVEKNYDEALRWLDRALTIAPNDWKLINATANVKRRQGKLGETIALEKRSAELDPLNSGILVELAWSYRGRRDLAQARTALDRALAISPNDANIIAAQAETYMAAGDLDKSWQMLRNLKFGPSEGGFDTLLRVVINRRDYDEAIRRINARREVRNMPPLFRAIGPAELGQLQFTRGDTAHAEPLLHDAERQLTQLRDQHEGGVIVLVQLLHVEACLGRRAEVEKIGEQLRMARRIDKWAYPRTDENLAVAYAQMGDADRAIPLLDGVLRQTYADAITPAYLRFDPRYDRIRNDPRFQKLCQEKPK